MRKGRSRRSRGRRYRSIQDVLDTIRRSRRILVITGAGISVSCGIPDFRSKDTGIYHTLDCQKYNIPSAELLFDLEFFMLDPKPFYKFSSSLIPNEEVLPSFSHEFIALLQKKKKLLRNYTQNIDGLERKSGITASKLIECHGTMSTFRCVGPSCQKKFPIEDIIDNLRESTVCYCKCGKVIKPMITFFGEFVPFNFNKAIASDVPKCDLVLVIGTSLKVGGAVHKILAETENVPHIFINRDPAPENNAFKDFEATILGDCDIVFRYLSERLGWGEQLKSLRMKYDSTKTANVTAEDDMIASDYDLNCTIIKDSVFQVTKTRRSRSPVAVEEIESVFEDISPEIRCDGRLRTLKRKRYYEEEEEIF